MLKRIEAELKEAMKAGDKARVSTLRLLLAALKNEKIQAHRDLTEEEIEAVIRRGVKQRRDSIEQYERGGRPDLVAAEKAELEILSGYLARELSEGEIEAAVRQIIADKSLSSKKEVGIVMKEIMSRYRGAVDGRRAQQVAQRLLP
jgi:uncharacterized protein YqeY